MLSRIGKGPRAEEPVDDLQRFLEPVDALAGTVEGQIDRPVVALVVPRAEGEVKPSVREQVERGELFGEDRRVPVVIGQLEMTDAKPRRRVRRGHQAGDRPQLPVEVGNPGWKPSDSRRVRCRTTSPNPAARRASSRASLLSPRSVRSSTTDRLFRLTDW